MVDFSKLKNKAIKFEPIDPIEIFRRLPKPTGFNDLYTSQADVLRRWFEARNTNDTVIKLHTGGGKTLVGLLIAASTVNETSNPVLYLAPTKQLAAQAIKRATAHGIDTIPYNGRDSLEKFIGCKSIMVTNYKALFNGKSVFGLRGSENPANVGAIVFDDAHAAFSAVREQFTLTIDSHKSRSTYEQLAGIFRKYYIESGQIGTFDDIIAGSEPCIIEVPYWAWRERLELVQDQLKTVAEDHAFTWPLLRDNLRYCQALINKDSFTITTTLPLVHMFPTFVETKRRIYMSATIADDSEIVRTFNANLQSVSTPLKSRSLAGVSERMILIPDIMNFEFDPDKHIEILTKWVSNNKRGAVILVPSDNAAKRWAKVAQIAKGSDDVLALVESLQQRNTFGPVVFANRYDGIDLPNDSCRLLVMIELPTATSIYERYRSSILYGSDSITRMLAQRIEQGIGRGARGSGDHCVVLLAGRSLVAWVTKETNFRFLTSATRAQLEMGAEVSREVSSFDDLCQTILQSLRRDKNWTEYHAATLADQVNEELVDEVRLHVAVAERKAVNLWHDGYHDKAIEKLKTLLVQHNNMDKHTQGWIEQLIARIYIDWDNPELASEFQQRAFANNRNLTKPKVLPHYRPLTIPGAQAKVITSRICEYRNKNGYLQQFNDAIANLHDNASANQFEQSLAELFLALGFVSERKDVNGHGPDLLVLLPGNIGLVIEAKSRKKWKNALTKEEHGQLLIAEEWFKNNYPQHSCIRISIHKSHFATTMASATSSFALTFDKLGILISDTRTLITTLCKSNIPNDALEHDCERLLKQFNLNPQGIIDNYLVPFAEEKTR